MDSAEELRIKKQNLLSEQIIDKGYDPTDFEQFCEKMKNEECDIDKWTYGDILFLIQQYQKAQISKVEWPNQKSDNSSPQSEENQGEKPFNFDFTHQQPDQRLDPLFDMLDVPISAMSTNFPEDIFAGFGWEGSHQTEVINKNQTQSEINNQVFENQLNEVDNNQQVQSTLPKIKQTNENDEVILVAKCLEEEKINSLKYPCRKLGDSLLHNQKNLVDQIKIEGFEIVQGNMFQQSYAQYIINVSQLQWKVKRRYRDFLWLRNIFLKLYPGYAVPTLIEKEMQKSAKSTMVKRKVLLEYFLKELLKTPEFLNSKFLLDFLSLDDKAFKNTVKESDRLGRPTSFDNYINTQGYVKLSLDLKSCENNQQYESLFSQQETIYQKIRGTLKELDSQYDSVKRSYIELSEHLVSLQKISEQLDFTNTYRGLQTQDMYKVVRGLVNAQVIHTDNVKQLIKDDLNGFFRFHSRNFNSIRQLLKIRNEISSEIDKRKDLKKETYADDLLSSCKQKLNRTKEMLEIPSKNLDILREQFSFYDWKLQSETIRFYSNKVQTYLLHFAQFSEKMQDLQQKNFNTLKAIKYDLLYLAKKNPLIKTQDQQKIIEQY